MTLLLGPTPRECADTRVRTIRFQTTADLEAALAEHLGGADVLVMAAAVADYRPVPGTEAKPGEKLRRKKERMMLELEPTPDLLAGCSKARAEAGRVEEQLLVGFALEPMDRLFESAASKLERKGVDLIVANPLETMDAGEIQAWLVGAQGVVAETDGKMGKDVFAGWLIDRIGEALVARVGCAGRSGGG